MTAVSPHPSPLVARSSQVNDFAFKIGTVNGTSITGPSAGYPTGTDLNAVCGSAPNCVNPTQYLIPSDGAGVTNAGFYDTLGRRYFIGLKANF